MNLLKIPTSILDVPGTAKILWFISFLLIALCYFMPTYQDAAAVGFASTIFVFSFLWLRFNRYKKRFWGNFPQSIAVIDHGRRGRSIANDLPERLQGQFVTCFGGKVDKVVEEIKGELRGAKNSFFLDPKNPIKVYPIYFAYGIHINEDNDTYVARVIETMDEARLALHAPASTQGDELEKGQAKRYKETYIETGLNGSIF